MIQTSPHLTDLKSFLILYGFLMLSRKIFQLQNSKRGFTKYCCSLFMGQFCSESFFCLTEFRYEKNLQRGFENIKVRSLVYPKTVILPSRHSEIGLIRNIVKAIYENIYDLKKIFSNLRVVKLRNLYWTSNRKSAKKILISL